MKFGGVLLALFAASSALAARFTATDISMPFYDDAGRLTHRLVAARGSLQGDERRLVNVRVEYFAAGNPERIVQRVNVDDAVWHAREGTLAGDGKITATAGESTLRGEGFRFALATSKLHVHRNFHLESRELALKSSRAVIDLVVEQADDRVKLRDVRRAEAIGDVVITVQPGATRRYPFDRALAARAIYDGPAQKLFVPTRIRYFEGGRLVGDFGQAEYDLGPVGAHSYRAERPR